MRTLKINKPSEPQNAFLRAKTKYVGYGGARGGGKSWAVQTKAKLLCLKFAGIKCLIVRRTFAELEGNHINTLRADLLGIARYNSQEKMLRFANGSIIKFMFCARDADLQKLQGQEYDVIFLDEATQLSEYQMKSIAACLRGVNTFPKRMYFTCNPGGQGHGYIKRVFIDRKFNENEDPDDYVFISAKVKDNYALMKTNPDYVKQLEALPPKLREAWLDGNWNIFEGQFFEEFKDDPSHYIDRRWTHVIEPFDIPLDWKIYRSYDYGYAKPFSVGWWAVDYEGTLYRILELYGCTKNPNEGVKWDVYKQAEKVHEIETQHPMLAGRKITGGPADPAIWDGQRGDSIADVFAKQRIYWDKGDHARIAGWMQMHYRFSFDDNGIPSMYIFKNCEAFIRTIPLMVYDETNVEDLDTDLEDHVADEARYMCMSRPIKPKKKEVQVQIGEDPLNQRVEVKKIFL